MHSPFIYKYQPLYLKDFEIDTELVSLIQALIDMDTLSVLFVGDSGNGKTSIIHAIIREYYNITNVYLQKIIYYILIVLRSKVYHIIVMRLKPFVKPHVLLMEKKKMLILDDLDIINEQSQQVFRNCIDKYSHNVHFIASTANTQKIIDSLQSRMTLVRIKPLDKDNLQRIMEKIRRAEELNISIDAKMFLLKISNNSVRILLIILKS